METSSEVDIMSEQKIEQFWRDATADDVARVMRGETVEARVRDDDNDDWRYGEYLGGVHRGNCEEFKWTDRDGVPWKHCQVYDPQEWFLNKPDPGEGYRLLEKFPHEELETGDEAFGNNWDRKWGKSDYAERGLTTQCETLWYRRRIANPPTSLESCRSREDIPSGWRLLGKEEERLASDAYWSQGAKDWIVIGDDRVKYANEFSRWHAIRQVGSFDLVAGFNYTLPSGKVVQVTAKGFEVV
jgi:hypothetical protein